MGMEIRDSTVSLRTRMAKHNPRGISLARVFEHGLGA
jgi:hypothetical protein